MSNLIAKYETSHGLVELSPDTVKRYLVSGNGAVTDQEVAMFIQLCQYQRLNPFLREAYLIKFGSEPAATVVGKDAFVKRAHNISECDGFEAGVIVATKGGTTEKRSGSLVMPGDTLVGGWAKVYKKNWRVPIEVTVSLSEYQRRKRDGSLMSNWANMPATMIRKVALVQALREAFTEQFQGLYDADEMPVDGSKLPNEPVNVTPPGTRPDVHHQSELPLDNPTPKQENQVTAASLVRSIIALAPVLKMSEENMKQAFKDVTGNENLRDRTVEEYSSVIKFLEDMKRQGLTWAVYAEQKSAAPANQMDLGVDEITFPGM